MLIDIRKADTATYPQGVTGKTNTFLLNTRGRTRRLTFLETDPISTLSQVLIDRDVATQRDVDDLNAQAKQSALEAVKFAAASPDTPLEELYTDVYADPYGRYAEEEREEDARAEEQESRKAGK